MNRNRSVFPIPNSGIHGGGPGLYAPDSNPGFRVPSPGVRVGGPGAGVFGPNRDSYSSVQTKTEHVSSITLATVGQPVPILPPTIPTPKVASPLQVYKTYQNWIDSARANTENIKKYGSTTPLVWVLVEGKNIPHNAIIGGEDRRGLLYIARSFFEGGLYIGKAGHHLELGAAIPFNGSEVPVSIYEVLVPAFSVFRYALSESPVFEIPHMAKDHEKVHIHPESELRGTIIVEDRYTGHRLDEFKGIIQIDEQYAGHPLKEFKATLFVEGLRTVQLSREFKATFYLEETLSFQLSNRFKAMVTVNSTVLQTNEFRITVVIDESVSVDQLSDIKTVILVDDSQSMAGKRWLEARDALAGVVDSVAEYGADGVDIFFLNEERYGIELKEGRIVRELFDSVKPRGQTPTGQRLREILGQFYLPIIENMTEYHKPIALIVVTDGEPTDDLTQVIIDTARRLDNAGVPLRVTTSTGAAYRQLGIQFVQIGDDEYAANFLRKLDDEVSVEHGVRDLVDTVPFNSKDPISFTAETLIKMLLGSLHPVLDNVPSPTVTHMVGEPFGRI